MTARLLGLSLLIIIVASAGADPAKPKPEQKIVPLWPDKAPGALGDEERDRPTLTVHLPDPSKATGTGVIVCPGGGYTLRGDNWLINECLELER